MTRTAPSIAAQVHAVQSGSDSARDWTARVRRDIEAQESRIHAWVVLSPDSDRQAAAVDRAPATLPLAGMPVGVKDIIDVAGLPTRAGTDLTGPDPATADAACVAQLKSLGAVIQGKTVTTEFAYLHPGPTCNPHAVDHTPGGSSSGSAAAVGAGTIPLALGSQTAGSLTRPASYCGTAGLVLTPGSVDMAGIVGLSPTLDSLGLLTRTVEDLRLVYGAFMAGAEPTGGAARVLDIRLWQGDGLCALAPEMASLVASMPDLVDEFNVRTSQLDWSEHVHRLTTEHLEVMSYEALHERRREYPARAAQLSEPLLELLRAGEDVTADRHAAVLRYRAEALAILTDHLDGDAVILGPATPGAAPAGLTATGVSVFSRAWQLLGLPVVVVPGARTATGLPLGLQIIGLPGTETRLLELGVRLEGALRGTVWSG